MMELPPLLAGKEIGEGHRPAGAAAARRAPIASSAALRAARSRAIAGMQPAGDIDEAICVARNAPRRQIERELASGPSRAVSQASGSRISSRSKIAWRGPARPLGLVVGQPPRSGTFRYYRRFYNSNLSHSSDRPAWRRRRSARGRGSTRHVGRVVEHHPARRHQVAAGRAERRTRPAARAR